MKALSAGAERAGRAGVLHVRVSRWYEVALPGLLYLLEEDHPEHDIHAGEWETALVLLRAPELIDRSAFEALPPNWETREISERRPPGPGRSPSWERREPTPATPEGRPPRPASGSTRHWASSSRRKPRPCCAPELLLGAGAELCSGRSAVARVARPVPEEPADGRQHGHECLLHGQGWPGKAVLHFVALEHDRALQQVRRSPSSVFPSRPRPKRVSNKTSVLSAGRYSTRRAPPPRPRSRACGAYPGEQRRMLRGRGSARDRRGGSAKSPRGPRRAPLIRGAGARCPRTRPEPRRSRGARARLRCPAPSLGRRRAARLWGFRVLRLDRPRPPSCYLDRFTRLRAFSTRRVVGRIRLPTGLPTDGRRAASRCGDPRQPCRSTRATRGVRPSPFCPPFGAVHRSAPGRGRGSSSRGHRHASRCL